MSRVIGRQASDIVIPEGEYAEEPLLPAGMHQAVVVEISEGRNEEKGEDWVKLIFSIVNGTYHGTRIADWWRFGGQSEASEQISNKKFKSILNLCGVTGALQSYDQLYGTVIGINNKPYAGHDGSMRNSINYYRRAGAQTSQAAAPTQAAPPVQQVGVAPVMQAAPAPAPAPTPAPAPQPAPPPAAPPAPPPAAVYQQPPAAAAPVNPGEPPF